MRWLAISNEGRASAARGAMRGCQQQPHQRPHDSLQEADPHPADNRPPGPSGKNALGLSAWGAPVTVPGRSPVNVPVEAPSRSSVASPPAVPAPGCRSSWRKSPTVLTCPHAASSSSSPKRVSRFDCSCTMARLSRRRSSANRSLETTSAVGRSQLAQYLDQLVRGNFTPPRPRRPATAAPSPAPCGAKPYP